MDITLSFKIIICQFTVSVTFMLDDRVAASKFSHSNISGMTKSETTSSSIHNDWWNWNLRTRITTHPHDAQVWRRQQHHDNPFIFKATSDIITLKYEEFTLREITLPLLLNCNRQCYFTNIATKIYQRILMPPRLTSLYPYQTETPRNVYLNVTLEQWRRLSQCHDSRNPTPPPLCVARYVLV